MASTTLPDFIHIGPRTSLYTPSDPTKGQLIILCTWLGAGRKHMAKYINLYQKIAPRARILLIESGVSILISTYVRQRREIQSAVSAVLDSLAECGQGPEAVMQPLSEQNVPVLSSASSTTTASEMTPKILLQTFSNGGTNTATQLLLVLHERLQKPLPLAGLICDSGPAKGTYWKSYDAMLLSLPKDIASQMLGAVACHCILILLYSWIACGNENPASLNRRIMLDNEIIWGTFSGAEEAPPNINGEGRVCYLYSKADRMCLSTDVADHAEDARRKGWQVDEIDFEDSPHCAHYSKYETKYANAVQGIWEGSGPAWTKKFASKI